MSLPFIVTGGFYQDKIGRTALGMGTLDFACELCVPGTFVSPEQAPGTKEADCKVCPTGTNKTKQAGFRACPCLDGYFRTDRFGPCQPCPLKGVNCSLEYQRLLPGYWWTWDFYGDESDAKLRMVKYEEFARNVRTFDRMYDNSSVRYNDSLPKPLPCPQGIKACPGNGDGINVTQCGDGYEGWQCSVCKSGYYSWFEFCVKCPSVGQLLLELFCVIIIVVTFVGVAIWDLKRQDKSVRSPFDTIMARFKIVISYYQIVGAIFMSIHDIHWPQAMSKVASIFRALELNLFKYLAKPRCVMDMLQLDIYTECVVGIVFCSTVVLVPSSVYIGAFSYYRVFQLRSTPEQMVQDKLRNLKAKCYFFVTLLLFITYLSMSQVIFGLMPPAYEHVCVDADERHCFEKLRSEYSYDCTTQKHKDYQMAAYATLLFVIGFPICLLVLIYRNKLSNRNSQVDEDSSDSICTEESIVSEEDDEFDRECTANKRHCDRGVTCNNENSIGEEIGIQSVSTNEPGGLSRLLQAENEIQDPTTYQHKNVTTESLQDTTLDVEDPESLRVDRQHPLFIRFLCENYKSEYWYWEIIELSRKVLQTLLVVMYGTDNTLTLGATIVISVVFAVIHAYFKPMKDRFEHWLQMLSLMAVFFNLLCAIIAMIPDSKGEGMTIFIIGINVSVAGLALGKKNKF